MVKVITDRHVQVERWGFGKVPERRAGRLRLGADVVPGNGDLTTRRTQGAGQDPHRCGLSGPVRPKKPKDLAFTHFKRKVVKSLDVSEISTERLDSNHVLERREVEEGVIDLCL